MPPPGTADCPARLIDLLPGHVPDDAPLWGAAIDIGTTTVSLWLVDLLSGEVHAQVAGTTLRSRGEDVISRIIYASKNSNGGELRQLVLGTINALIDAACLRLQIAPEEVYKATVAGNSTMMHLLLGVPASSIRLAPFVTAINHVPTLRAAEVGLRLHPEATVDCLPGVASYVGADITAGVLSSGLDSTDKVTLFIDVGTNGEIVLGTREWLVTVAASAGPAFEGGGVMHGMRHARRHRRSVDQRPDLRASLPRGGQCQAARHLRQQADRPDRRDVPHRPGGQGGTSPSTCPRRAWTGEHGPE